MQDKTVSTTFEVENISCLKYMPINNCKSNYCNSNYINHLNIKHN